MVHVFIDGFHEAPTIVAKLFGVNVRNNPHKCDRACGISQNYKMSLSYLFDTYFDAKYAIILEEDLEVDPDFMEYFSQLIPLLEKDSSLFCISAWNDNGYKHSANDPSMLYRIETMPGLGWILKRDIYKRELEPNWRSDKYYWDWDM